MLNIRNLHARVHEQAILHGVNLEVNPGEVHAIMGPNGAGKSTLGYVLAGRDGYTVTQGDLLYRGRSVQDMSPEVRAAEGIFLGFQYPVSIPGVNNLYFLNASVNAIRKYHGEPLIDAVDFIDLVKATLPQVGLPESFLYRDLNSGFSGGEKKRNQILQLLLLKPQLALLDETDSGLDIDALKTIAHGINCLRDQERSIVLITHYQRLLHHIKPDHVHIMMQGTIKQSGDHTLALKVEAQGYGWLEDPA